MISVIKAIRRLLWYLPIIAMADKETKKKHFKFWCFFIAFVLALTVFMQGTPSNPSICRRIEIEYRTFKRDMERTRFGSEQRQRIFIRMNNIAQKCGYEDLSEFSLTRIKRSNEFWLENEDE